MLEMNQFVRTVVPACLRAHMLIAALHDRPREREARELHFHHLILTHYVSCKENLEKGP